MPPSTLDTQIRLAAFNWLARQNADPERLLSWQALRAGFEFGGRSIPLISQRGIWKPAIIPEVPLSITTSPGNPYKDELTDDGFLIYHYCGSDPNHRDNKGLRKAFEQRTPLVYLHGVLKGRYLAAWPVYVVEDDPPHRRVVIAFDEQPAVGSIPQIFSVDWTRGSDAETIRRRYATRSVRQRLHQRTFRERVLEAYRHTCALCRLRHDQLLDAAHIVPDSDDRGVARVSNGLALCKLHHAAFDNYFIGIRPDHIVEVRPDVLEESDGPMLLHGLKEMHHRRISVPRAEQYRPDSRLLEIRYEKFRKVG
ncbi:MAG: HNH endonuclease [Acidobacteriota bacterium]|nr:HNH endonuclease [Acidobacteriota bacterium]MDQ7088149.1 HNH endonuclease [Acidobacteriota bacterium]